MKFSIITPNHNGGAYLEKTIQSVIEQRQGGIEVEYIIVDGKSTDNSHEIMNKYSSHIDHKIVENDSGPANAINKGLRLATGDILAWLGADDIYYPDTLNRIEKEMSASPDAPFCFGGCPIINPEGEEIRNAITRFKKCFFPISSRFTFQCINYISQPALFFRRATYLEAGPIREDMIAAWDYEFILRLYHSGAGMVISGKPLSAFRWHEGSISGQYFQTQFQEEYDAAIVDAGRFSLQGILHYFVRLGIVGVYSAMSKKRAKEISV